MATLTTTTGFQYYFQPSDLVAISAHQSTTFVYGLSGSGRLPIPGSPQELISQLSVASTFFGQLTGPDGTTYWFNKSLVTSVSNGIEGHPGTKSVVFAGGQNFFVTETLASAASSLGQAPSTASSALVPERASSSTKKSTAGSAFVLERASSNKKKRLSRKRSSRR